MTLKSIFALTATSLAFVACSSEDASIESVANETTGNEISFSTYNETIGSRGHIVDNVYLQHYGFYIFANVNNPNSSKVSPLMNDQHVVYDKTNSKWGYTPVKYWPTSADATVDFYANYNRDENTVVSYDWNCQPQITFYVNPVVRKQTDYLWAAPKLGEKAQDYKDPITKPVKFTFQHALTAYAFRVLADGETEDLEKLKINSITLGGYFAPKGSINPRVTDINNIWNLKGDWDERSYTISTKNGGIDPDLVYPLSLLGTWDRPLYLDQPIYRDDYVDGTISLGTENPDLSDLETTRQVWYDGGGTLGNTEYMMLLPYKIEQTYKITVDYTIYTTGDTEGQNYVVTKEVPLDLKTLTNPSTDINKSGKLVVFILKLHLNKIDVDASVNNWQDQNQVNVNLPE